MTLEAQIRDLSERLQRLEKWAGIAPSTPSSPRAAQQASLPTVPSQSRPTAAVAPVLPKGIPTTAQRQTDSGTGNLLGIIAMLCLVLAGAFLIKLAIDSGWLTPERQLGLAVLSAFGLIGAGYWIAEKDNEYAGYLPASGVIILYLAAYASHLFYHFTGPATAMLAVAAVSGISLWLYRSFRHDFYAISAAVGTYFVPVMIGEYRQNLSDVCLYFVFWSSAYAFLSSLLKTRVLPLLSAYFGIGILHLLSSNLPEAGEVALQAVAVTQLFQFAAFSFGVVHYARRNGESLSAFEAWAYFPLLVFFYGSEYRLIDQLFPGVAPWLSLACMTLLLALYGAARRFLQSERMPSGEVVYGFAAVVLFHSGYLVLMPEKMRPFLAALLILALAIRIQEARPRGNFRQLGPILLFCSLLVFIIEMGRILLGLFVGKDPYWFLPALASAAAIFYLHRSHRSSSSTQKDLGFVILAVAHLECILMIYNLTSDVGSIAVSLGWAGYSLAVLALGWTLRDEVMAKSSAVVLLAAASKALLYDVSSQPAAVRILCLAITGVLLYGCGYLFRRLETLQSKS